MIVDRGADILARIESCAETVVVAADDTGSAGSVGVTGAWAVGLKVAADEVDLCVVFKGCVAVGSGVGSGWRSWFDFGGGQGCGCG